MDTTDAQFLTNGRVEALEITLENVNTPEVIIKRKRGRPKRRVEKPPPPPVKQSKSVNSSENCTSSTHKKKKSDRKDICLICGKVINHNIKGHQAIHDKSETFKCDICGFETNVKLYMKNHMKKIHVAQRYETLNYILSLSPDVNNKFYMQAVSMSTLSSNFYARCDTKTPYNDTHRRKELCLRRMRKIIPTKRHADSTSKETPSTNNTMLLLRQVILFQKRAEISHRTAHWHQSI